MIASTTGKIIDYVLKEEIDKPESERTLFRLRTLSRKATAVIQDNLVGYDITGSVVACRPGTGALVACKLGIEGWSNMVDEDGNQVRPHFIKSKGGVGLSILSPKSLDRLPQPVIDELGGKVMEINGLEGLSNAEEEETDDETAAEDPTEPSATATASSSPPPSPPTTPSSATASSPTSEPAPLARA